MRNANVLKGIGQALRYAVAVLAPMGLRNAGGHRTLIPRDGIRVDGAPTKDDGMPIPARVVDRDRCHGDSKSASGVIRR